MSEITQRMAAMSVDGVGELDVQMDNLDIVDGEEEENDGVPPPHVTYKRYWYSSSTLEEEEIRQLEEGIRKVLEKMLARHGGGFLMADQAKWAVFFKNLREWDLNYTLGFRYYICYLMDKQFSDDDYEFKTRTSFDAHETAIIIGGHRDENGHVREKNESVWITWILHLAEKPAPFGQEFDLSTILGQLNLL